ncbi:hypothetical protein AB5J62_22620 [Amycolatopsis sp. cg5]|uniref:hypothetical protein n=1 Tax=Amycolatopsis sp. cg5 TaxID=3238802 RepID=UPI00352691C7
MRIAQLRRIVAGAVVAVAVSAGAATPAFADFSTPANPPAPGPPTPPITGFMWDCAGVQSSQPCGAG